MLILPVQVGIFTELDSLRGKLFNSISTLFGT